MYICIEILQPYMGPELKFAAFFQGGPKNHGYKWSLKWVATLKKGNWGCFTHISGVKKLMTLLITGDFLVHLVHLYYHIVYIVTS